jgi:predicted secreted acid phosphatase
MIKKLYVVIFYSSVLLAQVEKSNVEIQTSNLEKSAAKACGAPCNVTQCETLIVKKVDNIETVKQDIHEFKDSGAWEKSNECAIEKAKEALKKYLPVGKKKLALVFDIDDTALSNWEHIMQQDFGYNKELFQAWENTAQCKAIKPVLDLYQFAKLHGFAVFFITGRRQFQYEATKLNLIKVGFCNFDGLFLKPDDFKGPSACIFKSQYRAHIISMGYTIVLNIGDQTSDIAGCPQAHFNIKISNPMYVVP